MSLREREKSKVRKQQKAEAPPHASLNQLRMSPFKVRRVVNLIRGKAVEDALVILGLLNKAAAKPVLKLLKSAMANAEEKGHDDVESMIIKTAFVDGGPVLKRWLPRAMGRATRTRRRTADITMVLDTIKDKQGD